MRYENRFLESFFFIIWALAWQTENRQKIHEAIVNADILEVANNPNLNKNRGSTVRGDRWFELHVIKY